MTSRNEGVASVELGEEAGAYFREHLRNSSQLLQAVLQRFQRQPGIIQAHVPSSIARRHLDLTQFKHSILMYLDEPQSRPDLIGGLVQTIADHLHGEGCVAILQDTLTIDGGQVFSPEPGLIYLRHEHERYFLLTPEDAEDRERILETVEAAYFTPWQVGGVLTRAPDPGLSESGEISSREIAELAANATTLFVGAYDGEGYLTWSVR